MENKMNGSDRLFKFFYSSLFLPIICGFPFVPIEFCALSDMDSTKNIKFRPLNFVPILINSKKIQKNVKFDLQAHINMENKMNCSDRLFEL